MIYYPKNSATDAVIRTVVDPVLRDAGFARKQRIWNRAVTSDLVHVVELQPSKGHDPGHESFAINLGVFSSVVHRTCWGKEPPAFVRETDCVIRQRLTEELGDRRTRRRDQWWELSAPTDVEDVSSEVGALLQARGLPFLAELTTLHAIHDCLEQDPRAHNGSPLRQIYLAILKGQLGDHSAAIDTLHRLLAAAPTWRSRIIGVIDEVGRRAIVSSPM